MQNPRYEMQELDQGSLTSRGRHLPNCRGSVRGEGRWLNCGINYTADAKSREAFVQIQLPIASRQTARCHINLITPNHRQACLSRQACLWATQSGRVRPQLINRARANCAPPTFSSNKRRRCAHARLVQRRIYLRCQTNLLRGDSVTSPASCARTSHQLNGLSAAFMADTFACKSDRLS
jgi:hypothetical protein